MAFSEKLHQFLKAIKAGLTEDGKEIKPDDAYTHEKRVEQKENIDSLYRHIIKQITEDITLTARAKRIMAEYLTEDKPRQNEIVARLDNVVNIPYVFDLKRYITLIRKEKIEYDNWPDYIPILSRLTDEGLDTFGSAFYEVVDVHKQFRTYIVDAVNNSKLSIDYMRAIAEAVLNGDKEKFDALTGAGPAKLYRTDTHRKNSDTVAVILKTIDTTDKNLLPKNPKFEDFYESFTKSKTFHGLDSKKYSDEEISGLIDEAVENCKETDSLFKDSQLKENIKKRIVAHVLRGEKEEVYKLLGFDLIKSACDLDEKLKHKFEKKIDIFRKLSTMITNEARLDLIFLADENGKKGAAKYNKDAIKNFKSLKDDNVKGLNAMAEDNTNFNVIEIGANTRPRVIIHENMHALSRIDKDSGGFLDKKHDFWALNEVVTEYLVQDLLGSDFREEMKKEFKLTPEYKSNCLYQDGMLSVKEFLDMFTPEIKRSYISDDPVNELAKAISPYCKSPYEFLQILNDGLLGTIKYNKKMMIALKTLCNVPVYQSKNMFEVYKLCRESNGEKILHRLEELLKKAQKKSKSSRHSTFFQDELKESFVSYEKMVEECDKLVKAKVKKIKERSGEHIFL